MQRKFAKNGSLYPVGRYWEQTAINWNRRAHLFLIRTWQPLQTDFDAAKKYAGYKAGAGVDMLQNNITRFREFTRFRV